MSGGFVTLDRLPLSLDLHALLVDGSLLRLDGFTVGGHFVAQDTDTVWTPRAVASRPERVALKAVC